MDITLHICKSQSCFADFPKAICNKMVYQAAAFGNSFQNFLLLTKRKSRILKLIKKCRTFCFDPYFCTVT